MVDPFVNARSAMVRTQLATRNIRDPEVLRAMRTVPRHRFVPPPLVEDAYADTPLPIGLGQTISQPYVVAEMSQLARISPGQRVLEIGTGSGYQSAILAELGAELYSIEIIPEVGAKARQALDQSGFQRVQTRIGDGYRGWPEKAPFQAILVTASPPTIPLPLIDQLAMGGRLIVPVGDSRKQELLLVERTVGGVTTTPIEGVLFVPMTGEIRSLEDGAE